MNVVVYSVNTMVANCLHQYTAIIVIHVHSCQRNYIDDFDNITA